jgi:signal transduction histidine kinase
LQTSLKLRLALLLGGLLVAFLASLQFLRVLERDRGEQLRRDSLVANELVLKNWIDLTSEPIRRFARDFAQWDQLRDFAARPDLAWAETHLRPNLARHGATALWVVDASGRAVYSAATVADASPLALPPSATGVRENAASFFAESPVGLLEIWSTPLAPSPADAASAGRLVVARLWDAEHVTNLGRLSAAELKLAPAVDPAPDPTTNSAQLPLPGSDGRPVRYLVMRAPSSEFIAFLRHDSAVAYLFLGFGFLLVLALWLAVRRWVLGPLESISVSLAGDDPTCIRPLLKDRTELGRIAQLVESSFQQKAALGREIEEHRGTELALRESEARLRQALDLRARLARDLHDGVIQSIYAAGLGLEGAVSQLGRDPEGARARLQLCRQSLNDVIREVRGFISGIEPEALHHQGFNQELTSLVRTMQALWPVVITVDPNPAVIQRLSPTQELHALQICRECISNAVRHGGARAIDIRLGEKDGAACLQVKDNGRGFSPDKVRGSGSGLGNLSARARELGGALQVESRPGNGATITVNFPLSPAIPPA